MKPPQEYYAQVQDKLTKSFAYSHYVIAAGRELLADGWDPNFLVAVEPVDQLAKFTLVKGMQVHMPVVGKKSQSVLMPLDLEVFLLGENKLLYTDKKSQCYWLKQCVPVCHYVEDYFKKRGMPYLMDYTPSGAHFLWQNPLHTKATKEIEKIGYLEEDLITACQYIDKNDIKRWWGISLEAARVFSGLGKLAEYLSLITIEAFQKNAMQGKLPVTISDSIDRCINFDNSWAEGSPFMRSIRSPFSLHKKNNDLYGVFRQPPLVDVVGGYYDGKNLIEERDVDRIVDYMWDLEKAAEYSQRFSGIIPESNDTIIDFVKEYKQSQLFDFHRDFERTEDLPRFEALERAKRDPHITDLVKHILSFPNPLALQPKNMMGFVFDLLINSQWQPKHIANVLRDLYIDPQYQWHIDFFKYPAEEKANFWARTFSALALWKTNKIHLNP